MIIDSIEYHYLHHPQQVLTVYIPVRQYCLTLRHRLLDELGPLSHLLLEALSRYADEGLAWVQMLTRLSVEQLHPILDRLLGVGLIDGLPPVLTKKGRRLAECKSHLHEQERQLWLDGDYRRREPIFFGISELDVVRLDEHADPFVLRAWDKEDREAAVWPCKDWNEDCERQRQRLMQHVEHYLTALFEPFHDHAINAGGFNPSDWDLVVRYVDGDLVGIPVKLPLHRLRNSDTDRFVVSSPVMVLHTKYQLPSGSPAYLLDHQPSDQSRAVGLWPRPSDSGLCHGSPPRSQCWPESMDEVTFDKGHALLFSKAANALDPDERFFNREYRLEVCWQTASFDWPLVFEHLPAKGLYQLAEVST